MNTATVLTIIIAVCFFGGGYLFLWASQERFTRSRAALPDTTNIKIAVVLSRVAFLLLAGTVGFGLGTADC